VKTIKIMLIASMLLLVLFLPAVKIGMPTAEACTPSPPIDLTEPITAEEEQEIMNIIKSSKLVDEAIQWLKEKEITIDLSRYLIIKFSENATLRMPELNRYIIIILGTSSNAKHIGGIHVSLNDEKNIQEVYAFLVKKTKSGVGSIMEMFNVIERRITCLLQTETEKQKTYIYDGSTMQITSASETCEDAGFITCDEEGPPCPMYGSCPPPGVGYTVTCDEMCLGGVDYWCVAINCAGCILPCGLCAWSGGTACFSCAACLILCFGEGIYKCCGVFRCCCHYYRVP